MTGMSWHRSSEPWLFSPKQIPSSYLTQPWEMALLQVVYLLKMVIFHGYAMSNNKLVMLLQRTWFWKHNLFDVQPLNRPCQLSKHLPNNGSEWNLYPVRLSIQYEHVHVQLKYDVPNPASSHFMGCSGQREGYFQHCLHVDVLKRCWIWFTVTTN